MSGIQDNFCAGDLDIPRLRIALCGHGGHGKDTIAYWLGHFTNLRYRQSTSAFVAAKIFNDMHSTGYARYETIQACYDDRSNHRVYWRDFINAYNNPDRARLYKECLTDQDILTGVRRLEELQAVKSAELIDLYIWVYMPDQGIDITQEYGPEDCDLTIINHKENWLKTIESLTRLTKAMGIYDPGSSIWRPGYGEEVNQTESSQAVQSVLEGKTEAKLADQ